MIVVLTLHVLSRADIWGAGRGQQGRHTPELSLLQKSRSLAAAPHPGSAERPAAGPATHSWPLRRFSVDLILSGTR